MRQAVLCVLEAVLQAAIQVNDAPDIPYLLQDLVQGYQPTGAVVDWVHLALARDVQA